MELSWKTKPETQTPQQSSYGIALAIALGGKPYYEGTVDPAVVRRRRVRNKAARQARAAHRRTRR